MTKKDTKAPAPKPTNVYEVATSPDMNKKLHHRYVPMIMFSPEGKEVVLPMVVGSSRELSDSETQAYLDTEKQLGKVPDAVNQGYIIGPDGDKAPTTWKKLFDANRAAWLIYYTVRMPDDITKKFFENKEQVFDTYNLDELGILMDHYAAVRYTQPHYTLFDSDSPTMFQDAIDRIKKMGEDSDFFLNGLTTHSANQLIKYLVSLLTNLGNTTGSSGMPSSNTSPTEKTPIANENEKTISES